MTRDPVFADRRDAGMQLSRALERWRGREVLVLGIPRGGVPVAAEIARALDAELDVIVARKLGSPISPELAIGAVTTDGERYLNADVMAMLDVSDEYLSRETEMQRRDAERREARFRDDRPPPAIAGRTVIVVDDGLATGATLIAALRSVSDETGISVPRVALAWILTRPFITSIIIGAKTPEQLRDNLGATDVRLAKEHIERIDAASALPAEYPAWMVTRQHRDRQPATEEKANIRKAA